MKPVTGTRSICMENSSSSQNPLPHIPIRAIGEVPSETMAASAATSVRIRTKMNASGSQRSTTRVADLDWIPSMVNPVRDECLIEEQMRLKGWQSTLGIAGCPWDDICCQLSRKARLK